MAQLAQEIRLLVDTVDSVAAAMSAPAEMHHQLGKGKNKKLRGRKTIRTLSYLSNPAASQIKMKPLFFFVGDLNGHNLSLSFFSPFLLMKGGCQGSCL